MPFKIITPAQQDALAARLAEIVSPNLMFDSKSKPAPKTKPQTAAEKKAERVDQSLVSRIEALEAAEAKREAKRQAGVR